MPEHWEADESGSGIAATPVFFAHARSYDLGYVMDVVDIRAGESQQFAMEWSALPTEKNWTAHQAVEFFIKRTIPRITEFVGDRDLVLYFDCLSVECQRPHTLTRAQMTAGGIW